MNRLIRVTAALALFAAGCAGCQNETPPRFETKGPSVESLEPGRGPVAGGTVVLLRGDRFAPEARILFGGQPSPAVVVADSKTATAVTPPGAEGAVDVAIVNPDGAQSALAGGFNYSADQGVAPAITMAIPATGPVAGGSLIELHGTGFQEGALVFVGGKPAASITVLSPEVVTLLTPAGVSGTAELAVTNPDGFSGRLADGFSYFEPDVVNHPAPVLSSIVPTQGPVSGGEEVFLAGANFSGGLRVYIGGRPATGVALEAARIRALAPANKPGLATVHVTNPDGQTAALSPGYNYFVPPPIVARVDPASGPVEGGTAVTIYGKNFGTDIAGTLGGKGLAGVTFIDANTLRAATPKADSYGYADLEVTASGSLRDVLKKAFYYTDAAHPAPGTTTGPAKVAINRVVPSSGPDVGGITMNLLGDGFQAGAKVTVGGAAATDVKVLGATSLTFRLPAGKVGRAAITVENADRGSDTLDSGFNYYAGGSTAPGPRVSGVAPSTGPTTGGTKALIVGNSFVQGAKVLFGKAESASVKFVNATQLVADVPGASAAGAVGVTVLNPDGKADTLAASFAYYVRTPDMVDPTITGLTPNTGPAGQEIAVKVQGTGFQPGALVYVNDVPVAKIASTTATEIAATLPPLPNGPADVTVVNPDGLTAHLNAGFTATQPAPKVTTVRPATGPLAGKIQVLILGDNFDRGATVSFGRAQSPNVKWVDPTALTAELPSGLAGKVDVVVQNLDGQTATVANGFEYDPNWVAGPKPSITDAQPNKGPSTGGTALLIRGTGFDKNVLVTFADAPATDVVVLDDKTLYAVTPANTVGPAHVAVLNPDGQVAVLAGGFTYVDPATLGPKPVLTGTSPTSGKETAATTTLLTGKNFKTGAYIFFGGQPALNPLLLSSTIYQADAQPHTPGTFDVAITNLDGQSAILKAAFAYIPRPTVASVNPASGPTVGGTKVLVTGDGFQGGAKVAFGQNLATNVLVKSGTLLECLTPSGTAGPADVTITNPDGQESTLAQAFTFVPPPSFAQAPIAPASGPATGGTVAVITGDGFLPGVTVTVGGKPAVAELVDANTLVVELPAGTVGYADVTVKNADGQVATSTRAFLYKDPTSLGAAPTLSSVSPGQGPLGGNSRVALGGGNFNSAALVFFGMRPATELAYVAQDTLTVSTPSVAAAGKVFVAVTNPDGQTVKKVDAYEYKNGTDLGPQPSISAIAPQKASVFGGTVLAVGGANFLNGAQFFFAGRPADAVTVNSATSATVTAPKGTAGPATVVVTNPDGNSALYKGSFDYIVPPPEPLVVNPNTGSARGNTKVSVNGNNFQNGATVQIAGAPCANPVTVSPNEIQCTTPPGTDGPANVKVVNADGQSATLANGFTYVAPPDPQKVSPTSGPVAGGTVVAITGAFFGQGCTVDVGPKPCASVNRVSSTYLTCTVPAGTAGPAAITVTNADGQKGVLAAGFTYLPPVPPPAVQAVSPNYGSDRGGEGVTVTGTSFQVGAKVYFDNIAGSAVNVISGNSITVITPAHPVATVSVIVENPDGQRATLTGGYSFVKDAALPPLSIAAISPNTGAQSGGTDITITGNGFQSGLAVTLGTQSCLKIARISPTAVTCTTALSPVSGAVDVTITNPDGQQVKVAGGFTFDQGGRYVVTSHNLPLDASGGKRAELLVDVDKDNDPDLFEVGWANQCDPNGTNCVDRIWTRLALNDGKGVFTYAPANTPYEPRVDPQWAPLYHQIKAVDIDKDLDLDIVIVTDGGIVEYLNDGAGKFSRKLQWTCTDRYGNTAWNRAGNRGMAIFDADNDGDLDVAIARWSGAVTCWDGTKDFTTNGEFLLVNDGAGNFRWAAGRYVNPTTGNVGVNDDSVDVKAADFDKDGDVDVLIANQTNYQTRLYYNDGTGTFYDVSQTNLNTSGGNAHNAAVADIDKDGDLDFAISFQSQPLRLYVNDGTGKFTDVTLTARLPQNNGTPVIANTMNLDFVDVDNDSDPDMVVRQAWTGFPNAYLAVFRNDGLGFFGTDVGPTILPPYLGQSLYSYTFADVNKDGYLDAVLMNEGSQNRLLLNDTAGGFVRKTITDLPEEHTNNRDAELFDADADGDLDMVVCGDNYQRPKLWLNDGAGNYVDYTASRMPDFKVWCEDVEAVDIDNDGDKDVFVASVTNPGTTPSSASGESVYLFLNDGQGNFTDVTYPRLPSDGYNRRVGPAAIRAIDYDQDGDFDLVVGTTTCWQDSTSMRLWQNLGKNTGYFVDVSNTASLPTSRSWCNNCNWNGTTCTGPSYRSHVSDIQVADLNGDGWPDIFAVRDGQWYDNQYATVRMFLNQKNGSFADKTFASPPGGRKAVLFDADGDKDPDIYIANWDNDKLYLNLGGGIFSDYTPSNVPRVDRSIGVVVADTDKDGDLDLVIAKENRARPRVLFNVGGGSFSDLTGQKMPWSNDYALNIVKGDVDKDGDEDMVLLNSGQTRIFLNEP